MMNKQEFDLSVVLNLHQETCFLKRTMLSLEDAVQYAALYGIRTELVVVLDRPNASTKSWMDAYEYSLFDGHQVIIVDNGSLGVSRNDGIEAARGEYIATADGDDLVSFNMFAELYFLVRSRGPKCVAIPQFYYGFGDRPHLWEYYGTDKLPKLMLFASHPFVSRILVHRSLFDIIKYVDVRLSRGFAYEDWHVNCEALASGCEFEPAKDTILFYRQRPNSLLRLSEVLSTGIPPYSRFFQPITFLATCTHDYRRFQEGDYTRPNGEAIRASFAANTKCRELTYAANRIDPAVDIGCLPTMPVAANVYGDATPGAVYYRLCRLLGSAKFTDVVLMPFLSKGGGEKYVLEILQAIRELRPESEFLVLSGERFAKHEWTERLPKGTVFIDLYQACGGNDALVALVTLRLIQATAPRARVHFKGSLYACAFLQKFGELLPDNELIYYRFPDASFESNGCWVSNGFQFNVLSEHGMTLSKIITDCHWMATHDSYRLDFAKDKIQTIYLKCDPIVATGQLIVHEAKHRLLWASRLDAQKRPELLLRLSPELYAQFPKLRIDIFGQSVFGGFDPKGFSGYKNLTYRGGFAGFHTLNLSDYDALIYTSAYDGLPNILLEAMSAGLPVIAPEVGGIPEIVSKSTGYLVSNDPNEDRLVELYIDAISQLCARANQNEEKRRAGYELICSRHSHAAFVGRVAEVFGLASVGRWVGKAEAE